MSREIKFRVWDKDLAKYLGGCEIDSLMAELSADDDDRGVIVKQICPARYIFEQYTGLKDKNGNEIYEGDKIKIEGSDATYTVEYGRGVWVARFGDEPRYNIYLYQYVQKDTVLYTEVIGNIHENQKGDKK